METALRTVAEVRAALASGARSAEQIVAATLADIAARDPGLNAFVALDAARAMADARRIDELRRLGAPLGPLAGATIGIKDLIDVAGLPTGGGSRSRAGVAPAASDAPVVARLRAAGAIVLGKTHTVEFAFGGWGTNETLGTPRNPRDLARRRTPGGSSNGSGVAVAAGLCLAAIGSDTGGSIRLPASFCGVVGLKTTIGLVDKRDVLPLATMFDTLGPLTDSVGDAAALLAALAPAQDERRPGWSARLAALAHGAGAAIAGRRIGVIANLGVDLHPETARVFRASAEALEAAGAVVEAVTLPRTVRALSEPCNEILSIEAYRLYGRLAEAEPCLLGAPVARRVLSGRDIPAHRLMAILAWREAWKQEMALLFDRLDAIVTPTTPFPAPTLEEHDEESSPASFTRFVNFLDLAALSLPMGATPDGLPVGMQIVVPGLGEPLALEIGAALERGRGPLRLGAAAG